MHIFLDQLQLIQMFVVQKSFAFRGVLSYPEVTGNSDSFYNEFQIVFPFPELGIMVTESHILAELVDKTRFQTNAYIDKLKDTDLHRVFMAEGQPLNSAFWIIAHLAVTQNGLILRCTGGDAMRISWAKQFNIGSQVAAAADSPPFPEVMEVMNEVHRRSLDHIRTLGPTQLDSPNPAGYEIMGETTNRGMIIHSIRHEASHAGHLGWICKLHGIKTM
jgi:hypothetical protein